ncbi:MAG: hypothetical protein PHT16_03315 [Candidatus Pacebacteria bacterium]|nr:hypothetical protein [Candidatus Paceibacterota bacterium]
MKRIASVAVLPFPLTVISLFSYGILHFLGHVDDWTHVRFAQNMGNKTHNLFGCQERIIYLYSKDLHSKMLELLEDSWHLKRILHFAQCGGNKQTKSLYARLVSVLRKLDTEGSRRAITQTSLLISDLRNKSRDIWKGTEVMETFVPLLESLEIAQPLVASYPPDKRFLYLPVFKDRGGATRTEDDVNDYFEVVLSEGRIYELKNKRVSIVVGGPSRSGKSTLAVSLVAEMQNYIRSLKSRQGFSDLELSVGLANLDLATPTTQAIAEKWATDREKVASLKRPWNIALAEEAQRNLFQCREENNISIGDLPGGRVDDITELLASSADAAIIISNDWNVFKEEWNPLFCRVGLPLVAKIRSRRADEGFSSLITTRDPGKALMGRISSLNRYTKSWDLFIQWLAAFLLFEILPTQFEKGS